MALQARISSHWRKQKLYLALFFWAVMGWFLVDGLWRWPQSNLRYRTWAADKAGWPATAASKGWTLEPPEKLHNPADIYEQYYVAGFLAALGTLVFIYWATQKKRTLGLDDEAVYTPAGNRVPLDAITGIVKKQWESKGLATVRYQEEGKQRQFVVDDYKFEQEPTHQILAQIEERLLARVQTPLPN